MATLKEKIEYSKNREEQLEKIIRAIDKELGKNKTKLVFQSPLNMKKDGYFTDLNFGSLNLKNISYGCAQ